MKKNAELCICGHAKYVHNYHIKINGTRSCQICKCKDFQKKIRITNVKINGGI
jgi:hypothetical protein